MESAGIGEEDGIPPHEPMETSCLLDDFNAWLEAEDKSIADHCLSTKFNQLGIGEKFCRCLGRNRHKERSFNHPMRSFELAESRRRTTIRMNDLEH